LQENVFEIRITDYSGIRQRNIIDRCVFLSFFKNKTGLKWGGFLSPTLFNLALQKAIQSIQMAHSGMKVGKEQLNILAYADDIVLIGENEVEIRQLFVGMENIARKLGLQINQETTKCMTVERKNKLKQNI
jgi:hypothetical protein